MLQLTEEQEGSIEETDVAQSSKPIFQKHEPPFEETRAGTKEQEFKGNINAVTIEEIDDETKAETASMEGVVSLS